MGSIPWSQEESDWLREHYAAHGNPTLVRMMAERGWNRTQHAILGQAGKLGLHKDRKQGYRKDHPIKVWTPEVIEWFSEYAPDHIWDDVSAEAKRLFDVDLTRAAVQNARNRFGVPCNIRDAGSFAKGNVPHTKGKRQSEWLTPEGAERVRATWFRPGEVHGSAAQRMRPMLDLRDNRDGYREIKVKPRNAKNPMDYWIPLGAFNWMQQNGQDWPDNCKCVHIDRDYRNDDADNITPVPNELWPFLCGAIPGQMPWYDRETLDIAILYARVSIARKDAERRHRKAIGRPWKQDAKYDEKEQDQ